MASVVDVRSGSAAARGAPTDAEDARWHLTSVEQVDRALHGGSAVAIVCWPDEAPAVERLASLGLPRLLLLGSDAEPVDRADALEDWVRLPVRDDDVRARIHRLRESASRVPPRPLLSGDGRLIFQGSWVSLPPRDERIARLLVESYLEAVPDAALLAAGWPGAEASPATLRPRISRLRRRIAGLGLGVVALRGLGYAMQPLTTRPHGVSPASGSVQAP